MDETRRLAMRRAHVKNKGYCTCGKVVSGNGGYHAHKAMHVRRGEWGEGGHFYMTYTEFTRREDAQSTETK